MRLLDVGRSSSIKLAKSWTRGECCRFGKDYLAQRSVREEKTVLTCEEPNGLVDA